MILRVIELISSVERMVLGVGVVIMAVLITIDVFLRYFFGKPLLFADDMSVYCMIFITFVGAALTLKMKRHISVDMFYKMLPRRAKLWLDVATTFVGASSSGSSPGIRSSGCNTPTSPVTCRRASSGRRCGYPGWCFRSDSSCSACSTSWSASWWSGLLHGQENNAKEGAAHA